jgi:thioredoxin-like negative regulator of GroEL
MIIKTDLTKRDEFKEYVNRNKFCLVKVSASWCKPCKRMKPLFEKLVGTLNNKVHIVLVDADDGMDIYSYLKCKSIPYMVLYVDGQPTHILMSSKDDQVTTFFSKVRKDTSDMDFLTDNF